MWNKIATKKKYQLIEPREEGVGKIHIQGKNFRGEGGKLVSHFLDRF
jgi:hypothetical protein